MAYQRLWLIGGTTVVGLFLAWWLFWPASPDKTAAAPPGALLTPSGEIVRSPAPGITPAATPEAAPQQAGSAYIQSVRLQPAQPTKMETLKAEVTPTSDAPPDLTFRYAWKVNDRVVAGATGDALNLGEMKMRDRIAVTVTPNSPDGRSFAVTSPEVVVYGIAPTLTLEVKRPAGQSEGPSELQLVSVAPDSTRLTFSLAPPLIAGMTVDKGTGKITWPRPPTLKGIFLFGAAVEDENQTKVTRTFEVTLK
ncbi:MAG: hypothetical protein M0009_04450 [Deltaproteobacteria bacterium]|nr:hypothetical protein [Deltaproteobacteria bacterium]